MTKIVRKIRPTDYWRIGEHESWFSDMSSKGLHLHKMGTHFAHFQKGKPKQMEYRIEVTKDKWIEDEQIDLYEENGWAYITSYQHFHVFTSPTDVYAEELHTDLAEQSYTLQQLNKKLVLQLIAISIGFALMAGMLSSIWFLDGTPVLRLVEGYVIQQMILSLFILYYVYYATRGLLAIRALRKKLIEGSPIDHHAPWEKSLKKNTTFTIVFIVVALASASLPWYQLVKSDTVTLPVNDPTLPLVRLADIEQNEKLEREQYIMKDGNDMANRYTTNWSLFAPVQYESVENGVIDDQQWLDESGSYSPSITSEVYELTFQAMAVPLVSDLIKWHSYGDESERFIEMQHDTFDQLIVQEEDEKKQIFVAKGKRVMYIRYFGYADMAVIIELAAQKM